MWSGGAAVDAALARAVRAGHAMRPRVVPTRGGRPLLDGPLPVLSGQVVDRPGDGPRRTLTVEVEDATGALWDVLAPVGTELVAAVEVLLPDGQVIAVPLGVFDVDVQSAQIGPGGGLSLTCPDRFGRVVRARFLRPWATRPGAPLVSSIADLLRDALGSSVPILSTASTLATAGTLVFEEDRARAVRELATAAGVHVSFDREGRAVIADLPGLTAAPVWHVDAGSSGVLLGGTRERSRRNTANVVQVTGERADAYGPPFPPVTVWDADPSSPTYAGPDPLNRPDLAGPFGVVVYRYASPALDSADAAERAARTILARTTGLTATLQVDAAAHYGLDAFDPIRVSPPRRDPTGPHPSEDHLIDAVTHPLTPGGRQQITGRSTRADAHTL